MRNRCCCYNLFVSFSVLGIWVVVILIWVICCLSLPPLLFAQEKGFGAKREYPRYELEEIVVTASKLKEPIRKISRNVTVITAEDIAQAPSNNVVDLLARESGVSLRSYFGNDKWAGVDLRGMGETYTSNVVVMVDGMRINAPDLQAADLSSIPLDQIERIEIVRGAGSVLYGNGAVGGVINIITKTGEGKARSSLYTSYGSYDTFDTRVSHSGEYKELGLSLSANYYDSEGYRDNGYIRKKDAGLKADYSLGDLVELTVIGSRHEDHYGLPGPVSKEDLSSRDRRTSTDRPEDGGESADDRWIGGVDIDLGRWGNMKIRRGYRFREDDYILGYSPLISKADQTNSIDEDTKDFYLTYDKRYEVNGLENQLQWGVDHHETDYVREELSQDKRENSDTESLGVFAANDWSVTKDLVLRLGYRYNDYDGRYRTDRRRLFGSEKRWVNGDIESRSFSNHAYDAGIVYALNPDLSLFAAYATSFRVPNVDEFAQKADRLEPQEGIHIDFGGRYTFGGAVEASVTLFQIRVEDEIYFDEATDVNKNYGDKTRRQGVESDMKIYLHDAFYFWGNYTYTKAEFEKSDTTVPLVPEHKASLGFEWQIADVVLSLTGTYVGERYDGNDQTNDRFDKLDDYIVVDGKVTYEYKGLRWFVGVNNAFDELYTTIGFSETYYPMPTRNYYGGVEWTF